MKRKFDPFRLDVLKEAESIGAGSASTALSDMTGRSVKIKTTDLRVIALKDISKLISYPNRASVGMLLGITGGLEGIVLLLSSKKDALIISDIIAENSLGKEAELGKISEDALREMGNILVGAYLTSLSTLTNMNLVESTPKFMFDKAKNIGALVQRSYRGSVKYVFVLETVLTISHDKIREKIILILTNDSFDKLFNAMVDNNLK